LVFDYKRRLITPGELALGAEFPGVFFLEIIIRISRCCRNNIEYNDVQGAREEIV
jgi:hypothetical protein